MARYIAALLAVIVMLPTAAFALELTEVRRQAAELRDSYDELTRRYEDTLVAVETAHDELDALRDAEQRLAGILADYELKLSNRARQVYKHGATGVFDTLLTTQQPTDAVQRAALFALVQQRDAAGLQDAQAVRDALEQTRVLTRDRVDRLAVLETELEAAREALVDELEYAELIVHSLENLSSRQIAVSSGNQQGIYACPMEPAITHFIDSWGHPRSGGRGHRGTDIMGPMGAPVYAFTSGVVRRHAHSHRGGISLYLDGDDGNVYFYTHLQGYAPRGAEGTRVAAGEHIAYNGNTGNARGGAPHIHFERHPGGGAAVNPYSWLAAACFD
ncbi:MAG: peptidoglycan DD-metalloendopeptidase family protein [Nitriliruptoraceae bacterium]